jgi:hypothetical protein
MRILRLVPALVLAVTASAAHAADVVRNGGDVVTCDPVPGAAFVGHFVLDYLVAASSDPAAVGELSGENVYELATRLDQQLFDYADKFGDFLAQARGQIGEAPQFSQAYVWKKATLGLRDVTDEQLNLAGPLPDNCYVGTGDARKVRLRQTVARESLPGNRGVLLNYDPAAFAQIENDEPQWSFMMVHEWLWSHADDAFAVRNLNWLVHTEHFRELSNIDAAYQLALHGFRAAVNGTSSEHPAITLRSFGGFEPNGRPKFTAPELLVVSSRAKELKIVNGVADEKFLLRAGDDRLDDLCSLGNGATCTISVADLPPLPTTLYIERDPLADPIWDVKMVLLVP